jgi:hypothetical protein
MSDPGTTVSDTPAPPRLLPPEGAETGSVWLALNADGTRAEGWEWTGTDWRWPHAYEPWSPERAAESGWRLDDPHGLAAAVRLLEAAGCKRYDICRQDNKFYVRMVMQHEVYYGGHPTSALAAAQAALAEWRRERE